MATNPTLVGRLIAGRYRVQQRRGTGGHGIVLDGIDEQLKRPVAIKILRPQFAADSGAEARFRLEAQTAASMSHPNLNAVYDWGVEEIEGARVPYLVLEHLSGGSLRDMIDRGRLLTPSQALLVGLEVCRGLDYMHRVGVIHRDLKPANLAFGEDRHIRILDVALSRFVAEQTWAEPSAAGLDAARYASPEQARGARPDDGGLTSATDIYSLALTLIESVTGQVPFSSDSTVATLNARLDKLMPVSADFGPLATVLSRAGSAVPGDRYAAAEMGRALVQAAEKMPRPAPLPIVGTGLLTDTPFVDPAAGAGAGPIAPLSTPASALTPTMPAPPAATSTPGTAMPPSASSETRSPGTPSSLFAVRSPAADVGAPAPMATPPMTMPPTTMAPTAMPPTTMAPTSSPPASPAPVAARQPSSLFGIDSGAPAPPAPPLPPASPASPASPPPADPPVDGDDAPPETGYDPNVEYVPPRRRARLLIGLILVLAVLAGGAFVIYNALKDETYTVPELAGLTQPVAENKIAENDWKVIVKTERSETVPVSNVIRTDPPAGEKLAKGKSITFVISEGPPLATLPDVTGETLDAATAQLQGASLAITVAEERYDENIPAGTIIEWSVPAQPGLEAGAEVMPNTVVVSVVVSKGPEPRTVPNLLGMDIAGATAALANLQLLINQDPNDTFSNDYPAGVIAAQSLPEGSSINRGETVTVALSKGPDLRAMPPLAGLTYDQIVEALTNAGLTVGNITGDKVTQTITDATVGGVSVAPGQQFPVGTPIDLIFA